MKVTFQLNSHINKFIKNLSKGKNNKSEQIEVIVTKKMGMIKKP